MHHPESRMQEFFSRRIFSLHIQIYTPIEEGFAHAADRPSSQTHPTVIPTIPPPTPFPYSSTLRYWGPGTSPTLPPTPFPLPLRHSRTPTSFPHPPTSFPRRRESLPSARIASGPQQTRHIAPLEAAAPEPSCQETKRNHNSTNSFTRMRQEDRMPINAPSMKTVSASHEAK